MEAKDKEMLQTSLNELKQIIYNLIDKNEKIEKKIEEIKEYNKKQIEEIKEDNKKIIEEIKELKNRINTLEYDFSDLKNNLGDIQFRKQAKNFLRFFKKYLTQNELEQIEEDNNKKGEIILSAFNRKFSKSKKKDFIIVENLIKYSINLLNRGNNFAHSLDLDNYYDEIDEYKKENNIKRIYSPEIFCFCINLCIDDDDDFKDSFALLEKCFDKNLRMKKDKISYFESLFN